MGQRITVADNVYRKASQALWRIIEDQIVLIYEDQIFNLKNESAVFIWNLIDGKRSLSCIKEKMLKEYDVDRKVIGRDLTGFVKNLENLKLIKQVK